MEHTANIEASARRASAAGVSKDFAGIDDLSMLIGVAEYGFSLLFGGDCTIQLTVEVDDDLIGGGGVLPRATLAEAVGIGLAGTPSAEVVRVRPGILLAPESATGDCRAWIQFPTPRRIPVDELIVADLLAQAFAIAVDRVVALDKASVREDQLRAAIRSHEVIGQAVGVLLERHRLTPADAFGRLRTASQNRNIRLVEIATRVVETGVEPDVA